MTRKYTNMEPHKITKVSWSLENLQQLVNDENSHVHFEKAKRHIALHPYHLADLKKSLHEILGAELNYYNHDLKGLLLAYKKPKLLSPIGAILYDAPFIHVDIEADFYVFKPEIGCTLKGIINKKAENHIGVLVHKIFNVSISKSDNEEEDWQANYVDVGEEVTFTVMHVDFKGKLPFIRGELISSDEDGDNTITQDFAPRKSKKHQVTDEELNVDGAESDEDHSGNNGYISGPKSKAPNFLSSFASDSDSEEESRKSNKSSQDDTIKDTRIDNHSEDLDNTQVLNNSPKKDKLKKSAEKSSRKARSSDNSDSDISITNSTRKKSPKKSKAPSKSRETSERPEDEEKDVFKKPSKMVPRKRQHSESDTAASSDESSKEKKKRLKKAAESESEEETKKVKKRTADKTDSESKSIPKNTRETVETKPVVSRKSYKAHFMSDSEDSDAEISLNQSAKKEKNVDDGKSNSGTADRSPPNSLVSLADRSKKKETNNLSKDSDNSDDDFMPFAPRRNIKVEKGLDTSHVTTKVPGVVPNQNGALSSTQTESSELKKSPKKKKIMKSLENRGSDSDSSDSVPFSVRGVKQEKEKSKKTKSKVPNVSENAEPVNSDANLTKKKSKKSSKNQQGESDSSEQVPFGVQNIKQEKEKSKKKKSKELTSPSDTESVRSKKVKKEKKDKSKKSKKSDTSQEEDSKVVPKKIKKEKEKTIIVRSTKIWNLQVEDDSDSEPDNVIYNGTMNSSSEIDVQIKDEKVKTEKSKSKIPKSEEASTESDRESVSSKKIKREEDKSKRKKINKTDESNVTKDTNRDRSLMSPPPPPKPRKKEKSLESADESGELSDASTKSKKKLITKEVSVFLGNVKIKQEPMSDIESGSSRKRKREDSTSESKSALDIRVKREFSVVKSEPTGKLKKIKKDKSLNDSSVKSETNDSDVDSPRRKKSKTVFSE